MNSEEIDLAVKRLRLFLKFGGFSKDELRNPLYATLGPKSGLQIPSERYSSGIKIPINVGTLCGSGNGDGLSVFHSTY